MKRYSHNAMRRLSCDAGPLHDDFAAFGPLLTWQREWMVVEQIQSRGARSPDVLRVLRIASRHRFVPENVRPMAYEDHPLPIGCEATISQPYIGYHNVTGRQGDDYQRLRSERDPSRTRLSLKDGPTAKSRAGR
jgi:hypothetical protein